MPHLVVRRVRSLSLPLARTYTGPDRGQARFAISRKSDAWCSFVVEVLDIFGGIIFILGSVCFLPTFSHNVNVFLGGCALFVFGSGFYVLVCSFALLEVLLVMGPWNFETCENLFYLIGSVVFLVGTVLYWPDESEYEQLDWMEDLSFAIYVNMFTKEFEGTILFIVGSVLYCFAAFVNGLNQHWDGVANRMMLVTTLLYFIGSILFIIGSIVFLPNLGDEYVMESLGAWCFIVGSMLYVAGSSISLSRTWNEIFNQEYKVLHLKRSNTSV
mmetsp:Transcript_63447/g.138162  ORF Transcript_63447/g.138162 Transcript_63447/m.138162 type:complete len:271 (-) Transcript_63447:91-903(-)